jgi:tRNA (guanine-N7-)-methyltransferase
VGKNKLIKFEEIKTFKNVIQAPFSLIRHNDFFLKGIWAKSFFENDNPVILEVGCGKGEYTLALAENNPETNYIGIDIKGARIWRGAKTALKKGMNNVAFLRTNIEIIDQFFGQGEVKEIWFTFPDPQMKKVKKRLTSTFFLKKYRNILKESGILHLKTDSLFQYNYTKSVAYLNGFEICAATDNLYTSKYLNDSLKIRTFYEKQWLGRGIPIKYLAFKLNDQDYSEPEDQPEKDNYRSFGRSFR